MEGRWGGGYDEGLMTSKLLQQLDRFGPAQCEKMDYVQADAYTQELAESHYENFTVVSWFLPKRLRADFRHVYAFCRWADDLGDETGDREKSVELLGWWKKELDACYAGRPRHPVFVALSKTIEFHDIPQKPFDDLIDAFVQDQKVLRYGTWEQTVDYCKRSADPVGRLVLYVCGYRDRERQELSDATCTALQLANFWQDVRRDVLERDRIYMPEDVARKHHLDLELMAKAIVEDGKAQAKGIHGSGCPCCSGSALGIEVVRPAYRATMRELVGRTRELFVKGRGLWPMLEPDVRLDIKLFTLGGEAILKMIQGQNYDTLTHRPSLSKGAKLGLMMRAVVGKMFCLGGGKR